MTDTPERDLIEKAAKQIYATLHHLMRVTGTEAQDAYEQAARAIVTDLLSRVDKLEERVSDIDAVPEGAKFFKAMFYGSNFKWMELVQADAPQERVDAQSDFSTLLAALARKVEEIEAMDAALNRSAS